jgi:Na+/phosphate symporter
VLYLVGLIFFFLGLWIWFGLGQALFCAGAVLIATAFINAIARDIREQKHVV